VVLVERPSNNVAHCIYKQGMNNFEMYPLYWPFHLCCCVVSTWIIVGELMGMDSSNSCVKQRSSLYKLDPFV